MVQSLGTTSVTTQQSGGASASDLQEDAILRARITEGWRQREGQLLKDTGDHDRPVGIRRSRLFSAYRRAVDFKIVAVPTDPRDSAGIGEGEC